MLDGTVKRYIRIIMADFWHHKGKPTSKSMTEQGIHFNDLCSSESLIHLKETILNQRSLKQKRSEMIDIGRLALFTFTQKLSDVTAWLILVIWQVLSEISTLEQQLATEKD